MAPTQHRPDLSVVIPARQAADTLGDQLEALARQTFRGTWEVIVVDDQSTDATSAVAERYRDRFPAMTVIRTEGHRNAAHARNVGVRHARGRGLLFCDADDVVGEGWLEAMAAGLAEAPFVIARMEVTRLNPSWVYAHRGERQTCGPQMWATRATPYLQHGGAGTVGLRRELYEELGPFDERFDRCEGPGPEYCFRAQLAGYTLHFAPDAVVHLRLRTREREIYRQSRDWAEWSVAVERLFADRGLRRTGWVREVALWGLVLPRLVMVRSRADLVRWVRLLAWRVGRVRGCIRFGAPAL